MSFKGNKVWVALDPSGQFTDREGKVRIRYNLSQSYEYWVPKDAVQPEAQAVPRTRNTRTKDRKPKPRSLVPKTTTDPDLLASPSDQCVHIFTDGASLGNPGPAGIGVLLIYGKHEKEISEPIGITTNNVAELTAILRALQELKRRDLPVLIHSDSSYCIGLLDKGWKPQANLELINKIKNLMTEFQSLAFIKVKGHSGIDGNEKADTLASRAAELAMEQQHI
ncbi:MAG: ribonuclease H [Pseudomonadota bacterium]